MKQKILDLIIAAIDTCLIEPRGDPNRSNLLTAAILVKTLKDAGIKFDLRGFYRQIKGNNPGNHDFMKEVEILYGKNLRSK